MKVGSLFTGYGGLDMAAREVFGGELAWVSDNHPSAVKLLAYHHPEVPNLGDITAIDWNEVEPVDLLTAGWPCQDISNAGKRAGIEGERSGLWSHVADAVRVLRPRHVVLENVSALLVRGLDRVVADLAEAGYDLKWTCLRASDVGAPHRRERWFGYATPRDASVRGRDVSSVAGGGGEPAGAFGGSGVDAADTYRQGWEGSEPAWGRLLSARGSLADPEGDGWHEGRPEPAGVVGGSHASLSGGEATAGPDSDGVRQQPIGQSWSGGEAVAVELGARVEWGEFEPAIRRWVLLLGRVTPAPTQPGRVGNEVLNPRFVEWMQGLAAGWVTAVPGLSRVEMLRLLGNGVVPQQGEAALRWLAAQGLREAA